MILPFPLGTFFLQVAPSNLINTHTHTLTHIHIERERSGPCHYCGSWKLNSNFKLLHEMSRFLQPVILWYSTSIFYYSTSCLLHLFSSPLLSILHFLNSNCIRWKICWVLVIGLISSSGSSWFWIFNHGKYSEDWFCSMSSISTLLLQCSVLQSSFSWLLVLWLGHVAFIEFIWLKIIKDNNWVHLIENNQR